MPASDNKSLLSFGFLTVHEHEQHGLFGGYLILNPHGRPLEFHCTSPVKANRAQEILYGPTLKPFLYGEQIAATLIGKAKLKPGLVFTDIVHVLAARDQTKTPLVFVPDADGDRNGLRWIQVDEREVAISNLHTGDEEIVRSRLAEISAEVDVSEPFERIREAITEAHSPTKAA